MAEERNVTPLHLRGRYGLNIAKLAQQAKVSPSTVYFMMVGRPVARQQAEQVLATIATLTEQTYTLDNVRVVLLPEEQRQGEPTTETPPTDEESEERAGSPPLSDSSKRTEGTW